MNWRLVARQSLRESYRNWELPALVGLFTFVFGVVGYRVGRFAVDSARSMDALIGFLILLTTVLVPAVGLMIGQAAVAGQREDGRLRLVLGQPLSRREFVVGQYVAKAAVLCCAIVVAALALLLVSSVFGGGLLPVGTLLPFVALTVLLGLAYLGIAIALSSVLRTTTWTGPLAFGIFLLFLFVWRAVPDGILYLLNGFSSPSTTPAWTETVIGFSPSVAYERLLTATLDLGSTTIVTASGSTLVASLVLLWWIVLLPALAIYRFDSTDL